MKHEHPRIPFLDLDLLQTLVAIAETGSFSAAALEVGRTPSAISMQVKKMEELVGHPLFERDSRRVNLTADGAFLVEHANRMLMMNRDTMARFVAPDLSGVVRFGVVDDIAERFVPRLLRRFSATHPGVTVDVLQLRSFEMKQMVADGDLDIAVVSQISGGSEKEVLFTERIVWAMLEGGCAAGRTPLPVTAWNDTCHWRQSAVESLDALDRPWRIVFQSPHTSGQRAAVLADLAVAPIAEGALTDRVIEVPERYGLPKLPTYDLALIVKDNPGPAVQAAADHMRSSFRQG